MPDETRTYIIKFKGDVDQAEKEFESFARSMGKVEKSTDKAGKEVDEFGKKSKTADKASKGLFSTIVKGNIAANVITGAFQNMVRAITEVPKASVRAAAEFESSMTKIIALVGVSRDQVEGWKDDLKNLAPEVGKPLDELSAALFFISSAGFKGSEALVILEASAKASAAGLGETKSVADLVTSAVNAYGQENLSAATATDILTAAVREGKAEAPEFAASMGTVLPIASSLGVEFHEVAAATAAMTRTGSGAAEATTQLRAIMNSLLKPTSDAEEGLQDMGTSAKELRRIMREDGLIVALQEVSRLTDEYGEEIVARVFPNVRALAGALDLLGSNAEANVQIFEDVKNSQGATAKAFEETEKDADFLYRQLSTKLNVAMTNLGEKILPIIIENLEKSETSIDQFRESMDKLSENQALIPFWEALADQMARIPIIGKAMENIDWDGIRSDFARGLADPLKLELLNDLFKKTVEEAEKYGLIQIDYVKTADVATTSTEQLGFALTTLEGQVVKLNPNLSEYEQKLRDAAEAAGDGGGGGAPDSGLTDKIKQLNESLAASNIQLALAVASIGKTEKEIIKLEAGFLRAEGASEELVKEFVRLSEEGLDKAKQEEFITTLDELIEKTLQEAEMVGLTNQALIEYQIRTLEAKLATDVFTEQGIEEATKKLEEYKKALEDLDLKKTIVKEQEEAQKELEKAQDEALKLQEEGTRAFEVFVGNTISTISDFFKDSFDSIGDGWDAMLDSMADALKQFAAAVLTNAIVVPIVQQVFGTGQGGATAQAGQLIGGGGTPGIGAVGGLFGGLGDFGAGFGTSPFSPGGLFNPAAPPVPGLPIGNASPSSGTLGFQIGQFATLGAPLIGAALGAIFGGAEGALQGGLGGAGFLGGTLLAGTSIGSALGGFVGSALPIVGTILGTVLGGVLGNLLGGRPPKRRLGVSGTAEGILSGDFDAKSKDLPDELEQALADAVSVTLDVFADTLSGLPEALDELFGSEIDIEAKARFGKGKNVKKFVEQFIQGGFLRPLFEDVSEAFVVGFEEFGLDPEIAQKFTDQIQEEFNNIYNEVSKIEDREEQTRLFTQLIDQFLVDFNTFKDAIAILPDEFDKVVSQIADSSDTLEEAGEKVRGLVGLVGLLEPDLFSPVNASIRELQDLSTQLGFTGIPTLQEFKEKVREMIDSLDIDPDTVAKMQALSNGIQDMRLSLAGAISELVSFINTLNSKITELGGVAIDVSGALDQSIEAILDVLENGSLTLEQREAALRALAAQVDQLVSDDLARQQQAINNQVERQRQAIDRQVAQLESERDLQRDINSERIDQLRAEGREVEAAADFVKDLRDNVRSLTLSASSIESPFERLDRAQSELADLQSQFNRSSGEDRIAIGKEIQDLFNDVLSIGGEGFDNTSPEFRAIFRDVVEGLNDLADQVEPTKSIEQINSEIANLEAKNEAHLRSIDSRIDALRAQGQNLQTRQIQVSESVRQQALEYYEYIRQEAIAILEQRLEQLNALGIDELGAFSALEAIEAESLITLRNIDLNIAALVSGAIPAAGGFSGIVNSPSLFLAGEGGIAEEVNITPLGRGRGGVQLIASMDLRGARFGSPETLTSLERMFEKFKRDIIRDINHGRSGRRLN